MIPNGILSTTIVISPYLAPDDLPYDPLVDHEMGGVGISDASTGLLVQEWTATLVGVPGDVGTSVWISSPNTSSTLVFAEDGITEISLTFDQNMKPCIGYFAGGRAKIRWYDATIPGFSIIILPDGSKPVRCSLDDKRPLATLTSTSDIIAVYIYDGGLYMLVQRERFTTPHLLLSNVDQYISNPIISEVGMNVGLRLQITLKGNVYG